MNSGSQRTIYYNNNATLPLEPKQKRVFSVWLDSQDAVRMGALGKKVQTAYPNPGQFGASSIDDYVFPTFDLYYKLPFALQSSSGFFNVSVKSFLLGQQMCLNSTDNTQILWNTSPIYNNLSINLEASSPYSGYCVPPSVNNRDVNPIDDDNEGFLYDCHPKRFYNILPIGNANIFSSAGDLLKYTFRADQTASLSTSFFAGLPVASNVTVDDYGVTCRTPKETEIHIVLSTIAKFQEEPVLLEGKSDYSIRTVPFQLQSFNKVGLTDTSVTPTKTIFTAGNNVYVPFDLPYRLCLQFTEV